MNDSTAPQESPATRQDIQAAVRDLKIWMLKREVWLALAFVGIQISYFSITLAGVWFMVSQQNARLLEQLREMIARLPK